MAEPTGLVAREPLAGFHRTSDGIELSAPPSRGIASIALGADATEARAEVERVLGIGLPEIGAVADCDFAGGASVLGLQADQWFVSTSGTTPSDPASSDAASSAALLGDAVDAPLAITDQSDAWVSLVIEGPRAVVALERVCRLDLHPDAFAPGRVARTAMEHLAVIVVRETDERFVLLSPRSSAVSFAHALETSVRHVRRHTTFS